MKIEHIAMYVNDLETANLKIVLLHYDLQQHNFLKYNEKNIYKHT